ncbi:hypothetical protein D3C81_2180410 [compost metagenome]
MLVEAAVLFVSEGGRLADGQGLGVVAYIEHGGCPALVGAMDCNGYSMDKCSQAGFAWA